MRATVVVYLANMQRLRFWQVCGALVLASSGSAAQSVVGPVLHEYFDWSAELDVEPSPQLPAGLAENVDIIPTDQAPPDPAVANGAVQNEDREQDEYQLDGNTSQPDRVGYSDPFTPSIPPFKRVFAYDTVNPELRLVVANPTLSAVPIGGAPSARDDQFYGEVAVNLIAGEPVRLPSVGPGARVLSARLEPAVGFELLTDSAENLFISSSRAQTAQWVVHFAIERAVFGSPFPNVSWETVGRRLPNVPPVVHQASKPVLEHIGVSRQVPPAEAVRLLVDYFRSFAPEEVRLTGQGVSLYREVSMTRRGVCRHRAFAFTVSALALGLPTRFVRNEAHAWVEVHDGSAWHRIDLGGAAGEMSLTSDLDVHEVPADPYTWPPRSESGERMVARSLSAAGGGDAEAGEDTPPSGAQTNESEPAQPPPITPSPSGSEEQADLGDALPLDETVLSVRFGGATLRRGERFGLQGSARTPSGEACALMRIDVELYDASTGHAHAAGTLVTDAAGRYAGELVLPSRVPVGDYTIRASTPGHQTCGPATSP